MLSELRQGYDYIHFCCHGTLDIVTPDNSALRLNQIPGDDYEITARELKELDLGRARVVTFSACESALSSVGRSHDLGGLPGSVLRAGGAAVVGARWPVDDDVAMEWMEQFHLKLKAGVTPCKALENVRIERMSRPESDWACFGWLGLP